MANNFSQSSSSSTQSSFVSGFAGFTQPSLASISMPPLQNYTPEQQAEIYRNTYANNPPILTTEMLNRSFVNQFEQQQLQIRLQQEQLLKQEQLLHQQQISTQEPPSQPEIEEIIPNTSTQEPPSQPERSRKSIKKMRWTDDEYQLLVENWIHISEDGYTANNQPSLGFWSRIRDAYNESAQERGIPERSNEQLSSKWRFINQHVKLFNGFYNEAVRLRGSGTSDEQLITGACAMFKAQVGNFLYLRQWHTMKTHPRWISQAARDDGGSNDPINVDGGEPINLAEDTQAQLFRDDPIPRPPGKKRSKTTQATSSGTASAEAQEKSSGFCNSLVEHLKKIAKIKKSNAKKKAETFAKRNLLLEKQLANEEAAEQRNDFLFLSTSTENLSKKEAEFVNAKKQEIRIKYNLV